MRKIFLLFLISIFLISCGVKEDSDNNESITPEPSVPEGSVPLLFENKSNYDVNVYIKLSPEYTKKSFTISPSNTYNYAFYKSPTDTTIPVFFEYLIKLGNAEFPYWPEEEGVGIKIAKVSDNGGDTITIDPLTHNTTKSAYFLVENNTTSDIYLKSANTPVMPYGTDDKFIKGNGGCQVYEINFHGAPVLTGYCDNLQFVKDLEPIAFPLNNSDFNKGYVYTIAINTDDKGKAFATVKSLTPFNVDTQKKIWTRTTLQSTDLSISAVRPKKDVSKGYLAAFSSKKQPNAILMKDIDVYGNTLDTYSAGFLLSNENPYDLKELSMIDFIEAADGSSVILGSAYCEKKDDNSDWYIDNHFLKYDFTTRIFSFQKNISQYIREHVEFEINETKYKNPFTYFSPDRQNTLIEYEDNKYALSGCAYLKIKDDDDSFNYYYYSLLILLDSENSSEPIEKIYVSNQPSTNLEQVASSIFYNKKDSCFYVTEYYDWDPRYKSSIPYKSRLLKFDSNLENKTVVLDEENMLFLGITGDSSTGKYYITGENYSTSGQKGVLISSSNVTAGEKLKSSDYSLYFAKGYSYAWFNQVCICGNNIVACGAASSKPNAEELPIVVAFNSKGELQWQNTDYSGYTSAKSCFATSIGTYLVNLVKTEDKEIKACAIVSADLLGKATGNVAVLQ